MNLKDLSLCEAASRIREGTLSPVQYLSSLLERIEGVESGVRAWVTIDREGALAEARICETEAGKRQFRGPLHGIPIGIKDIFNTHKLRTTMGSPIFKEYVPSEDAETVARLRQSGAIIMGKTVTTAFALLDPGPTRNPWNLAHTPGGSSSGSAAAVASRMCAAAIGTQTVGSVGRPAAFNGLVSIVPTQARISRKGVFPLAWSLDHVGAFTRSVADLELMLQAMTGAPADVPADRRPYRIGLIRDFFYENATPEARSACDALAQKLGESGFAVDVVRLPDVFESAGAVHRTILRAEVASIHESLFREHRDVYGPKLRAAVETGALVAATDYLRARRIRRQYQRDMARLFNSCDVLLTPAAKGTAPEGITATGDPILNGPWTLADFPTVTLPHALGINGLPMGIQLSARPLQEGLLLRIAHAVEAVIGFTATPNM